VADLGAGSRDCCERGSDLAEHSFAALFGCFQSIAEIEQFVLQAAGRPLVNREAQVADQPFQLEAVQRNVLDATAFLECLEGSLNPLERIAVLENK
jgi:hypothetical protein